MSKSESRGRSTSSAVDQDVCIVVISKVKMSIVENVTEAPRIIEQQANEIVELQNKIRVLEQDLVSAESELQGKAFSLDTCTYCQMIKSSFTGLCREMCSIRCGVRLKAAETITLYSKQKIRPRYIE